MKDQLLLVNIVPDDNDVVGRRDERRAQIHEKDHRIALRDRLDDRAGGGFFDSGGGIIARGEDPHIGYEGPLERWGEKFGRCCFERDADTVIVEDHRDGRGTASKSPLVKGPHVQDFGRREIGAALNPARDRPGTGRSPRKGQYQKSDDSVPNSSRLILWLFPC